MSLTTHPQEKSSRRPITAVTWSALRSAMTREREALPLDSPRRTPSLPVLAFLERDREPGGAA
jgi:hypothetical protein